MILFAKQAFLSAPTEEFLSSNGKIMMNIMGLNEKKIFLVNKTGKCDTGAISHPLKTHYSIIQNHIITLVFSFLRAVNTCKLDLMLIKVGMGPRPQLSRPISPLRWRQFYDLK